MFRIIKDNLFLWFLLFIAVVSPSLLFGAFQLVLVVVAAFAVILIVGVVWLRWKVRKLQKEGGGAQYTYTNRGQGANQQSRRGQGANQQSHRGQEPDVEIFVQQTEKKVSEKVGDYVDFEELPDEEK